MWNVDTNMEHPYNFYVEKEILKSNKCINSLKYEEFVKKKQKSYNVVWCRVTKVQGIELLLWRQMVRFFGSLCIMYTI